MNATALQRLREHGPIAAEIIRQLIDGKSSQEILSNVDVNDEVLAECVALFDTTDGEPVMEISGELVAMWHFCTTGEGVLSFLQNVFPLYNEKHPKQPNLCLFPFTMTYADCENWTVTLDAWTFQMTSGNLRITAFFSKHNSLIENEVSQCVYAEKCLYSYRQWMGIVANAMGELTQHLEIEQS